jgi:hypothetical protein
MSLVLFITPEGHDPVNYYEISLINGRQAIDHDFGPFSIHQQIRYRFPGVVGNYLLRENLISGAVRIRVRYMEASAIAAEALYHGDAALFTLLPVTIQAFYTGTPLVGFNLIPGSFVRASPIRATGRTAGQVYFDATMAFTRDNPGESI